MTPLIASLIDATARQLGLQSSLVGAIVQVESDGYTYAYNPEPRYRWFWDVKANKPFRRVTDAEIASETPPSDFPCLYGDRDQEWWAQQASFGLMQVMGAVAREEGFAAQSLLELCDPEAGLLVGCRHLRRLVVWADGHLEYALGAYNAGKGNAAAPTGVAYAAKVLAAQRAIEVKFP
jgi:soluble lytic murein transglycosylase-like protein